MTTPTKPPPGPSKPSLSKASPTLTPQKRPAKVHGHFMDMDTMTLSAARRKHPRLEHVTAVQKHDGREVELFKVPLGDSTNLEAFSPSNRDGKTTWTEKEQCEDKIANLQRQLKDSDHCNLIAQIF